MKKRKNTKGLMKKLHKGVLKIVHHKTFKNKLYATILEILGFITLPLLEGDITVFIFLQMFAIPLYLEKENAIVD